MSEQDGLICAYLLDGQGMGHELDWSGVQKWQLRDGVLWIHLHRNGEEAARWLSKESGLEAIVCEALLAEETRPRVTAVKDGLLVILRGVNLNPGADPEDMVSVRLWIDAWRVISVRIRHLMAIEDIRNGLASGGGPKTSGDFLVQIAEGLIARMGPVMSDLDDEVDALEDQLITAESRELRTTIAGLRRQAIGLRRYLAPQRDVLSRLQVEPASWLDDALRLRLREATDRVTRYVEDLDAARERAAVTQEELANRLSEQMNRTMYVLSLVAAVFLPLGLLTGLLGINVGGIPWAESAWGFVIVTALLLLLAAGQFLFFRWRHLF
jgi:zinc transporter